VVLVPVCRRDSESTEHRAHTARPHDRDGNVPCPSSTSFLARFLQPLSSFLITCLHVSFFLCCNNESYDFIHVLTNATWRLAVILLKNTDLYLINRARDVDAHFFLHIRFLKRINK